MALSGQIEAADRRPSKPARYPISDDRAVTALPRNYELWEADEKAAAARVTVRMGLGRHDCPSVTGGVCAHRSHVEDASGALTVLRALGLVDDLPPGVRRCGQCRKGKPLGDFRKNSRGALLTSCEPCRDADRERKGSR